MSTESHKVLVRRLIEEVHNTGNLGIAGDFIAVDFVEHDPMPGQGQGLAGAIEQFDLFLAAFTELHTTVEDLIAEGDRVVYRTTTRGVHTGDFLGLAPTGRRFTMAEMHIVRIANGKVAEHWGLADSLGLLQQLGAISLPAEPNA